jgi:hypothetical protein
MNFYIKQAIQILFGNLALYFLLLLVVQNTSLQTYYALEGIALFFMISTFAVVALLKLVHNFAEDKVGFAFMGLILLKGFGSFLFLLPGFLAEIKPSFAAIMFFFLPYFIFLIYEVITAIGILNSINSKN